MVPPLEAIRELAEPILVQQEAELIELTCRPRGGVLVIGFLVDKVGRVTLQECARMNQLIGQALDASGLLDQSYTLEVSSPGLDRPLVTPRDYARVVGEEVTLLLRTAAGAVRESQGQLLAVQPEAIVLKTDAGNVTISLRDIHSATKVIHFG